MPPHETRDLFTRWRDSSRSAALAVVEAGAVREGNARFAALEAGALGVSISGAGPTSFALCATDEQSAAVDDFADSTQRLFGPDFPDWISVEGSWGRLRSAKLGVEWSAPSLPGAQMHAGRELIGTEFDWAGLDYLFPSTFGGATYHLNIQEAR